jgi:hypothetical protein
MDIRVKDPRESVN